MTSTVVHLQTHLSKVTQSARTRRRTARWYEHQGVNRQDCLQAGRARAAIGDSATPLRRWQLIKWW